MLTLITSNDTPTDVTPSVANSGITTKNIVFKVWSSNVVPILEKRIDSDVIELDNIARGKGGIVAMQACMERDQKHLLQGGLPIYA